MSLTLFRDFKQLGSTQCITSESVDWLLFVNNDYDENELKQVHNKVGLT